MRQARRSGGPARRTPSSRAAGAASASARRSPAGVRSSKSSSSSGISTKRRVEHLLVGERQARRAVARAHRAAARRCRSAAVPWRGPPASRPSSRSSALQRSSSPSGSSAVSIRKAGVEEARLVEDLADGVGVVGARSRRAPSTPRAPSPSNGGLEVGPAVADVGAKAEVAGARALTRSLGPRARGSPSKRQR